MLEELSKWGVGLGILTVALAPLAIPILVLTAVALVPLLVPLVALAVLAAPVLLARRLLRARRGHRERERGVGQPGWAR